VIPLVAGVPRGRALTILCLGAHADDIEIGCGGTIMRILSERPKTSVVWVVASGSAARAKEAKRSATRMLRGAAARDIRVYSFRDGFLPFEGARVKEMFEELKAIVSPDLIFTHRADDAHQDHRLISQLTWNTFRDHTILEYEIPKYDGDLGHPNVFVSIPAAIRRKKLRLLMSAFPSQQNRRWFTPSTFEGLMRVRGIECAAPDGFAEAFHGRKLLLDAGGRA
jgi:LmbE family N-acetylglucosaminyl deacetylase